MSSIVPYSKQSTLLCVNMGGYAGLIPYWYEHCQRIYLGDINQILGRIRELKPDAIIWHINDQETAYGYICTVRAEFPKLPIVLIVSRTDDEVAQGTFEITPFVMEQCAPVDARKTSGPGSGIEMRVALDIAYMLIDLHGK